MRPKEKKNNKSSRKTTTKEEEREKIKGRSSRVRCARAATAAVQQQQQQQHGRKGENRFSSVAQVGEATRRCGNQCFRASARELITPRASANIRAFMRKHSRNYRRPCKRVIYPGGFARAARAIRLYIRALLPTIIAINETWRGWGFAENSHVAAERFMGAKLKARTNLETIVISS